MKSAYQIIRRPVITEKGLGVKETEAHAGLRSGREGDQDGNQEAVQTIFKVKVDSVRTANFRGQGAPPRQVHRLPSGLEEGVRAVEGGRENARVRAEPVDQLSQFGGQTHADGRAEKSSKRADKLKQS